MSLSPMRKSSKYERRLLLFLAVVIFPTAKIAIATDAGSQSQAGGNGAHAGDGIPTGFKLERYAGVWEHNPFMLGAPTSPPAEVSAFDKLFLTSWLNDGGTQVIFVQNLETNEAQRITVEPNKGDLRLLALHLNPNPRFVEALISDGKEQGLIKFRFDAQFPIGQTTPPVAQMTNKGAPASVSNPASTASATLPQPQLNPQNSQTLTSPTSAPADRRPGSGTPRSQMRGGQGPVSHGESEGRRLPAPGRTSG
jgi:hypothetical protein